jgi:type VI secretion system secreted protein Hcp
MAFDAFIKIDGIVGESTRAKFEKQIQIESFSWGASNPSSMGHGTGGAAGTGEVSSFSFTKKTDSSSPKLFEHCVAGEHLPTAVVTLRKAGGKNPLDYVKYEFEKVFIQSVQWSGPGADDVPTENVQLSFSKAKMTYTPQNDDSTPGAAVVGSWDRKTGTA